MHLWNVIEKIVLVLVHICFLIPHQKQEKQASMATVDLQEFFLSVILHCLV